MEGAPVTHKKKSPKGRRNSNVAIAESIEFAILSVESVESLTDDVAGRVEAQEQSDDGEPSGASSEPPKSSLTCDELEEDDDDDDEVPPFDFLFYKGAIDGKLTKVVRERTSEPTYDELRFVLITGGGDPDAAYRTMRTLQNRYKKISILVPAACKSAGTLMALGAHEIAFGPDGELGPLDVQIQKKDEIFGRESGAAVIAAMSVLHEQCFQMFEHFFLNTVARSQGSISARMATDIAAAVSGNAYKEIFGKIDPHHLGETQRAMEIGQAYGLRLAYYSENIEKDGIERLIVSYPDHGFVIDRAEANDIFTNCRDMNEVELAMSSALIKNGRHVFFTPFPLPASNDEESDSISPHGAPHVVDQGSQQGEVCGGGNEKAGDATVVEGGDSQPATDQQGEAASAVQGSSGNP